MSRQRRWVRCLENEVLFITDECRFFDGLGAPEKVNNWSIDILVDGRDNCVSELLPAKMGMRVGFSVFNGENRI